MPPDAALEIDALLPGDVVQFGPDERSDVVALYRCGETIGATTVEWTWIALADGRLLEIAPRGCALYEPAETLARGSPRFLDLVAQDGLLVRFEERVRDRTLEARPVRVRLGGRRWRVTSTGTVTGRRLGPAPASTWGQLDSPEAARPEWRPTIYFTLAATDDPSSLGLGVWAIDICLAVGRRLGQTPRDAGLVFLPPPKRPD